MKQKNATTTSTNSVCTLKLIWKNSKKIDSGMFDVERFFQSSRKKTAQKSKNPKKKTCFLDEMKHN